MFPDDGVNNPFGELASAGGVKIGELSVDDI
jgi:hypothetical protein